ncbi:cyclic nucleotide-gated cation channel alpha-3-like [Alosa alosa]|uniref:cyclic nucleotide-gated cation channel alpha-3-like n=1 Tax=Alosa sapidissima TaxID=34773 RepID=UPI001C08CAD2|nr:cyclic nucleotide-gated cation channel alpha-3-like [Alosa sapidissima]XP_048090710.1 cyclic nucleotide-gated cation channel alpha-3-like [Alosa alosa]
MPKICTQQSSPSPMSPDTRERDLDQLESGEEREYEDLPWSQQDSFSGTGAMGRVSRFVHMVQGWMSSGQEDGRRTSIMEHSQEEEFQETCTETREQALHLRRRNHVSQWPLATYNMNNCNNTDE